MNDEIQPQPSPPPELSGKASFFVGTQGFLLGLLILGLLIFLRKQSSPESRFKVREADRKINSAQASPKSQRALPGFRIDGKPHEILGVAIDASAKEIQRAYRDLMKRHHPDQVGRPGSREWKDAQKIAEAIIRAKEAMIKK